MAEGWETTLNNFRTDSWTSEQSQGFPAASLPWVMSVILESTEPLKANSSKMKFKKRRTERIFGAVSTKLLLPQKWHLFPEEMQPHKLSGRSSHGSHPGRANNTNHWMKTREKDSGGKKKKIIWSNTKDVLELEEKLKHHQISFPCMQAVQNLGAQAHTGWRQDAFNAVFCKSSHLVFHSLGTTHSHILIDLFELKFPWFSF